MPKNTKDSKKLGRDEVLKSQDLRKRFLDLKRFLGENWGRIGRKLVKARKPEDIRTALNLVPSVEWCIPFRDEGAKCLLQDGSAEVGWRELRLTRAHYEEVQRVADRLWSEYHDARRKAEEATTALKAEMALFGETLHFFPFVFVITLVAKELGVRQLTDRSNELDISTRQAQKNKEQLKELLSSQEGWFARNEVLGFVRSTRFEKSVVNFAKAMAGLPEYGWLYSFRKCSAILERTELTEPDGTSYRLFELIRKIVKRVRPISLRKIEAILLKELLKEESSLFLRGYVGPNWVFVQQALKECKGKRFDRAELPHRIMERIVYNFERPKTITELELAKRAQLPV